jgi:hypothetical protein
MTAMLRAKFGLNDILGLDGEKNRNDHRHHAVDACVIAVTDQGMLQRFARKPAPAHVSGRGSIAWSMTCRCHGRPTASMYCARGDTRAVRHLGQPQARPWARRRHA